MATTREEATLRLCDQAGGCNNPYVERCALWEVNGAGKAVVIERLTQLRRELTTEAEIVDVISEEIVSRAHSSENIEYVSWSVGTSVRHACYQVGMLLIHFRVTEHRESTSESNFISQTRRIRDPRGERLR